MTEVHALPACLEPREIKEKQRGNPLFSVDFVQELLADEACVLESTQGASAVLPKAILRVLADRACGGQSLFILLRSHSHH